MPTATVQTTKTTLALDNDTHYRTYVQPGMNAPAGVRYSVTLKLTSGIEDVQDFADSDVPFTGAGATPAAKRWQAAKEIVAFALQQGGYTGP